MNLSIARIFLFVSCFTLFLNPTYSQHSNASAQVVFNRLDASALNLESALIKAKTAEYFTLSPEAFGGQAQLLEMGQELILPTTGGRTERFVVYENHTMSDGLKMSFPGIATADVRAVGQRGMWGKVSYTAKGFHAMIFETGQSTIFIDPLFADDSSTHIAYRKSSFETEKHMDCIQAGGNEIPEGHDHTRSGSVGSEYQSCALRTYRLAVATTGEYAAFHGGTVEEAMAAIVITINRVSGVYERDLGVSFTLIDNNADVVYTDAATDPFSNNNAFAMLGQNQDNMNAVIGAPNYDVGHVFSTGAGGVAGLGVTCNNNNKARGVTGIDAPIGDPFDIDYVAHELGHQFGANHTYNNSCGGNRNNATAAEPGSGSTIMAYAGICFPSVQNNSDDHFHTLSLEEAGIRITTNTCPVVTELNNSSPVIAVMPSEVFVPVSTPFSLSAEVIDLEDDQLTYAWEQIDVEISAQPPQAESMAGPNFRSVTPSESETRFFPNLNFIAFGGLNTWERLPSVEREMNFRLSVRDNNPQVGCTQYGEVTVNFVNTGAPFRLIYPSDAGIVWQGFNFETVLWDVAGTTQSPVNAAFIDLYLSVSDFPEFDILLASGVPNTGAYTLSVPNIATTTARIMARSSQGTFFDISDQYFTIEAIDEGVFLEVENLFATACQDEEFTFTFTANAAGPGANEPITLNLTGLPAGVSAVFDQNPVAAGEQVVLTLLGSPESSAGSFQITLQAENELFGTSAPLSFDLLNSVLNPVNLTSPTNGEMETSINAALQWTDGIEADETYSVQVALDADFDQVVISEEGLDTNNITLNGLAAETTYYWRVGISNQCVEVLYSEVWSFTTLFCASNGLTNANLSIEAEQGSSAVSTLEVETNGLVGGASVTGIQGSHNDKSQLYFSLVSPEGTTIGLGGVACGVEVELTPNSLLVQSVGGPSLTATTSPVASFGPPLPPQGIQGAIVLAYDDTGVNANKLCNPPINAALLKGKVAIVYRGGGCDYVQKVLHVQAAGAIAVVVVNDVSNTLIEMGGQSDFITIPAVMIGIDNGTALLQILSNQPPSFDMNFDEFAPATDASGCTLNGSGTSQPDMTFSTLNGELAAGTWSLRVDHFVGTATGVLQSWQLGICVNNTDLQTESSNAPDIRLYPNPTNGMTAVSWQHEDQFTELILTDISGRRVMQVNARGLTQIDFNMSGLAAGVYVINLIGDRFNYADKLILTR